ncbi:MAG: hypothetical protein ACLGH4_03375 [Actinomycetes bacterium]
MARTGRRRAEVRRSRAPLLLALVALLGIAATVAATALVDPADLVGEDPEAVPSANSGALERSEASGTPSAEPPSPAEVDLSNLPIPRSLDDCSALDGDPVRGALGAPVTLRQSYASGDRVEVSPGVTDVVAEDGCVFRSPRADARVWVFSAPVGTAYARTLVRQARRAPGCSPQPDGTGFGDPTLTDVCTTRAAGDEPPTTTVTLRGLFGDAWLSCSLGVQDESRAEVLDRARRWCTDVATTLGAG